MSEVAIEKLSNNKELKVIFVLGGPGSGKGTQCANIVKHFGFTHLSVGDLLRAEVRSGSENGTMIEKMINEGKIVPSEVTIKLLQRAMRESRNDKFLIDGFPRNEENRVAFENIVKIEPEFVLFFDCPEEEMERRILNRNQGRDDDNMGTIRKRFKVFIESTLPVIEFYSLKGKIYKIDACKPADEVFEEVKNIFSRFRTKEVSSQETNISTTMGFELVICLIKRGFFKGFDYPLQPDSGHWKQDASVGNEARPPSSLVFPSLPSSPLFESSPRSLVFLNQID